MMDPVRLPMARTPDSFDMFNGSPDRYDWKLIDENGRLIPYNSIAWPLRT